MRELELPHNADVATGRGMRTTLLLMVGGMLLVWLVGETLGYSRSAVRSPVPSATAPPSSYQRSLVATPNPVDNSGNLLVTGNVAGGKYFHGGVPYRSTTSIDAPLGSTTLDSFMRYTAPADGASSSQGYSTFYSPTGTVTTLPPGARSVLAPITPGASGRSQGDKTAETSYLSASAPAQVSTGTEGDAGPIGFSTGARLRRETLPGGPEEMSSVAADGLGELPASAPQTTDGEVYQQQLQELRCRLGQVQTDALELERSLTLRRDQSAERTPTAPEHQFQAPEKPSTDGSLSPRQEILQETARLLSATIELPRDTVSKGDATVSDNGPSLEARPYSGAGLRLYDPQRDSQLTLGTALLAQKSAAGASLSSQPQALGAERAAGDSAELPALQRVEETSRAFDAPAAFLGRPATDRPPGEDEDVRRETAPPNVASTDRVAALLERLRTTSGGTDVVDTVQQAGTRTNGHMPQPSSTGESGRPKNDQRSAFSQTACESHLQTGQSLLQQGKYLRAAESFALASAYSPNDPRAYLGKCQASFAAGEFIGSALALAKAIELDPNRALQRTDLVWISGGPDAFVARFNDLAKRAETGDAPQLRFLLAYVYYQMERPQEAKTTIDAARRDLPSSVAVGILDAAISR